MDGHGRSTDCDVGVAYCSCGICGTPMLICPMNQNQHMTGTLTTNEMCVVKLAMPDPSGSMKAWDVEGHNYTPVGRVHDMTINWAKAQALQMLAKIGCMCCWVWVWSLDGNPFFLKRGTVLYSPFFCLKMVEGAERPPVKHAKIQRRLCLQELKSQLFDHFLNFP